jgi:hypothetical protein
MKYKCTDDSIFSLADPDAVPTPASVEPTLIVPERSSPGLFGPRTPESSIYDRKFFPSIHI